MELDYVVQWNREDKKKTWSGSAYSLHKALQKHFSISDVEVNEEKGFLGRQLEKYLKIDDFMVSTIKRERKRLNKRSPNKVVFQFTEYVNNPHAKTYIYQDLSVEYLVDLHKNNPSLFQIAWGDLRYGKMLAERERLQMDYYENATGILCMGRWLHAHLVDDLGFSENNVHHVGGGINIDKEKIVPSRTRTANKVLFVGRDFERKGGGITVEAYKLLRKRLPHVELYVAGPRNNPIEEDIDGYHFLGDLDYESIVKYFTECDIFCMPSYFEAYGLVFVEALCSGLPCIGRSCYEMPYFIEDEKTGLLLNEDNAEALSFLMQRLLTENHFKENVAGKRDWYMSEYSWETVAERIAGVIQNRGQNDFR